MKNDEKASLLAALDELGGRYSERERPADAPSAWADGVRSARELVDGLVVVETETEPEVSDDELREFPRMQAVCATIRAGGGRATRRAILEGAAIVGAFVEYELKQAEKQREREAEAGELVAPLFDQVLKFEPQVIEPGREATFTSYASDWMQSVELELDPENGFEVSEVMVGDKLGGFPPLIQKGERVRFTVRNHLDRAVTVLAMLHGDNVPLEVQTKGL